MLDHAAQSGRHPLAERGNDLYETPVEATRALLGAVPLPSRIWEPACGRGAIVNVLRAACKVADRRTFILRLETKRADAIPVLRAILKTLLRRHAFRCVDCREERAS
jgi:hypothetical protein